MAKIDDNLTILGLDNQEISVYQNLMAKPWLSAQELSRYTNIKRSTIYRVIERLVNRGLVEQMVDSKTTRFNLESLKKFEDTIRIESEKITQMKHALSQIKQEALLLKSNSVQSVGVKFYRGVEGLQALEWQLLETPNVELKIFGAGLWDNYLGTEFAENNRLEEIEKNIRIKEVLNHSDIIPVDGKVNWTKIELFIKNCYRHRVINRQILPIDQEIVISNDTIRFYSFEDNEMIGVALTSKIYALLLSSLFEVVWGLAKPIDTFANF